MAKIKIKIPSTGQYYLAETDIKIDSCQQIIVTADNVTELAVVCSKAESATSDKTAKILRVVTEEDKEKLKELKADAKTYLQEARSKVFRHGLDIKILDVDLSLDQKKLTFYFSASGRVDFRSLVSDMVGDFGKIIRLQQVGPRDETKLFGGYGKCGQELCCYKFLSNLDSISAQMGEGKDGIGKSPKMAGCCGKLMCCLTYEKDADIKKVEVKK